MPTCVGITVVKKKPDAILHNLSFDTRCASNKPLERGPGTREMLSSAILFIKSQFPWVNRLILSDFSTIHCGSKKIPLSDFSFLIHQQTWYERYFDAKPLAYEKEYNALKETYANTVWTPLDWPYLWAQYFKQFNLPKRTVSNLFKSYPKATDFFRNINERYKCEPFKDLFQHDFHFLSLLNTEMKRLDGNDWWIPLPTKLPSWFIPERVDAIPDIAWSSRVSTGPKWLGGKWIYPKKMT